MGETSATIFYNTECLSNLCTTVTTAKALPLLTQKCQLCLGESYTWATPSYKATESLKIFTLEPIITKTSTLVRTQGAMPLIFSARADEDILPGLADFDYDVT